MTGRLTAALVLIAGLAACFSTAQTRTGAASAAGGGGIAGGSITAAYDPAVYEELGQLVRLEDENLILVWEVKRANGSGDFYRTEEEIRSDGAGQVQGIIQRTAPDSSTPFTVPSPEMALAFGNWGAFLVRYRGLAVYDIDQIFSQYTVSAEGSRDFAGRMCRIYRLESIHGRGTAEILVDDVRNLVLAWYWRSSSGTLLESMETLSVDFDPDHTGVQWADASIQRTPYDPALDPAALGFEPLLISGPPAGYVVIKREVIRMQSAMPDVYLETYTDGLNLFFVAQQRGPGQGFASGGGRFGSQHQGQQHAKSDLGVLELGPVLVAEGIVAGIRLIQAGRVSEDEVITLYGSAHKP